MMFGDVRRLVPSSGDGPVSSSSKFGAPRINGSVWKVSYCPNRANNISVAQ
jgi:hypothetical protein